MTDKILIDRSVVEQALGALFMYKPMVTGVTFQHGLDAMQALRAALDQPQVEQEPVAWQRRMRTKWMLDGEWWPWQECSKEVADDYNRAPIVNDWEYESRALYTNPQPPRQPLTEELIRATMTRDKIPYAANIDHYVAFTRAIEAAHGIKEQK